MFTNRTARGGSLLRRSRSCRDTVVGTDSRLLSSSLLTLWHQPHTSNFQRVQRSFWSSHRDLSTFSHEASPLSGATVGTLERENMSTRTPESFSETIAMPDVVQDPLTAQRNFLVNALANDVTRSVMNIIQTIDNHQTRQLDNSTNTNWKGGKRESLMDRWTVALDRERWRYEQSDLRNSDERKRNRKMTVDEIWVEALRDVSSSSNAPSHTSPSTEGLIAEPVMEEHVSPLFRFEMDTDGRILEGQTPVILQVPNDDDTLDAFTEEMEGPKQHDHQVATAAETLDKEYSMNLTDGVLQALALFVTARKEDWNLIADRNDTADDNGGSSNSEQDAHIDNGNAVEGHNVTLAFEDDLVFENEKNYSQDLFDLARDNKFMLTSEECNLILARMLSDSKVSEGEILARALQLFNEMNKLRSAGLDWSGPNSTTYRLLFLALPRRLVAIGEAAQICKGMVAANIALNPDTVLEAMRVCRTHADLETATAIIEKMLAPGNDIVATFPPCAVYLDILMDKNMMKEALLFYESVKEVSSHAILISFISSAADAVAIVSYSQHF